jgi:GNAT superfamily N-acetyltransferase
MPAPQAMSGDEFGGYFPGALGQIATLHGRHYSVSHGLGSYFEARVARDMGDLVLRFDPARDFWRTVRNGERLLGSIAIDGGRAGSDAHLRCFIVAPEPRGRGYGKRLLDDALGFCRERGFARVYLWTLAGLEPAGRLYRDAGFTLAEEVAGEQWGKRLVEQRLELPLVMRA